MSLWLVSYVFRISAYMIRSFILSLQKYLKHEPSNLLATVKKDDIDRLIKTLFIVVFTSCYIGGVSHI